MNQLTLCGAGRDGRAPVPVVVVGAVWLAGPDSARSRRPYDGAVYNMEAMSGLLLTSSQLAEAQKLLDRLIAEHTPGFALQREFQTDPGIYQLDLQRICAAAGSSPATRVR